MCVPLDNIARDNHGNLQMNTMCILMAINHIPPYIQISVHDYNVRSLLPTVQKTIPKLGVQYLWLVLTADMCLHWASELMAGSEYLSGCDYCAGLLLF